MNTADAIWMVELLGQSFDLKDLADVLHQPWADIVEEAGRYYLKSSEFEILSDATQVCERAKKLTQLVNGSLRIRNTEVSRVTVGPVIRINGDGSRIFHLAFDTAVVRPRGSLAITKIRADNRREVVTPPLALTGLDQTMSAALNDPEVERVLRLMSRDLDWANLYRIYEVVKSNVTGGETGLISNGWVDKRSVSLFRHTANNPRATGDESRHGQSNQVPPPAPLALPAAQEMIRRLVDAWMRSK